MFPLPRSLLSGGLIPVNNGRWVIMRIYDTLIDVAIAIR
jgi:hypothetical protein